MSQRDRDPAVGDRRRQRRAQTKAQILDIAVELMTSEGVGGLSLSALSRRMGIQPPSMYKYFPSRHAVYDALFKGGQEQYLATVREASGRTTPGLEGLNAALDAGGRWIMRNQALAQLLFWRPVPGFTPTPEAYAPAVEVDDHMRSLVLAAVERGELHPDAVGQEGLDLCSSMIAGMVSQQLSNEPEAAFDDGRFTRLVRRIPELLVAVYPPPADEDQR